MKPKKRRVIVRVLHVKELGWWFVTRTNMERGDFLKFATRREAVASAVCYAKSCWHGTRTPAQVMVHSSRTGRFNEERSYGCDSRRRKG